MMYTTTDKFKWFDCRDMGHIMTLAIQWTIQQHRKKQAVKRQSKGPLEKVYGHSEASESDAGVDAESSKDAGAVC